MIATRLVKSAYSRANALSKSSQSFSRGLKTLLIAEHAAGALLPGKPFHTILIMRYVLYLSFSIESQSGVFPSPEICRSL